MDSINIMDLTYDIGTGRIWQSAPCCAPGAGDTSAAMAALGAGLPGGRLSIAGEANEHLETGPIPTGITNTLLATVALGGGC